MARVFLTTVFVLTWMIACAQGPRNVIRGEIEGLEVGDKIILSVEDPDGATWIATDSTIVSKAGEFTLVTSVTGSTVLLARVKAGEAFNPGDVQVPRCFLEGYAELRVTGNVKEWFFLEKSGGLYAHPGLQRLVSVTDRMTATRKEIMALLARARETGDARLQDKMEEMFEAHDALARNTKALEREFREQHPGMAYSAAILRNDHDLMEELDRYEEAFHALAPGVQDSPEGRLARDYIASVRASGVGAVAPDFTLADMDGNEVTLSAFRGKHVLIDFWGSWCEPCRDANPRLVALHDAARAKNVNIEFISIATNEQDDEGWREAIKEDKLTWIQLNDTRPGKSRSVQKQYAIRGVPSSLLISPDGIILYKGVSFRVIPEIKKFLEL
jgi:thiol-disulfide isomerase/thioredoxin